MIYLIFLLSITFHEIGHIISSKIVHRNFGKIYFGVFGFSNKGLRLSKLKPKEKVFILASGSLFNLLLAVISFKFSVKMKYELFFTNIFIAIFNLLPIIPLDGGNILISILNCKFEIKKSIEISLVISKIFLVTISFIYCIMIVLLKNIFLLILIIYLWYLYFREESSFKIYFRIEDNLKVLNKI